MDKTFYDTHTNSCAVDAIWKSWKFTNHYNDVIMGAMASQITSLTIVYSIVYSDADQRKHQSSASLAFVWGIHRGPVNSPHKWPFTRKIFDDVIMNSCELNLHHSNPCSFTMAPAALDVPGISWNWEYVTSHAWATATYIILTMTSH